MKRSRSAEMVIRDATRTDAAAIAAIYNHYIRRTAITFEEEAVPAAESARRIREVQSASLPWLVAERDGDVVGYAYATKWHGRSAYRFSVEITVYIEATRARLGIATRLYERLLSILQERGI